MVATLRSRQIREDGHMREGAVRSVLMRSQPGAADDPPADASREATSAEPIAPSRSGFDYESIPPGYYDHVFHRSRGAQSKWHHLKFERVTREIASYRRVLDIGCGPGTFVGSLDANHDTLGVDVSGQQVAYANLRYGSPQRAFHHGTVAELPDSVGEFDAVTAIELIEHLSPADVKDTLEAAVALLRPGGRLVVTTPNFGGVWPLVEWSLNRFGDVDYELQHTNKFTRSSLAVLITMLGLRHATVGTYLGAAPFAASLGWRFADCVADVEGRYFAPRMGLLLIGTGIKPA
jgi:2-polyprenyl-3-methyl-5-hydroxy-6-metoxy-1,4-benzoquinol methylase